MTNVSSDESASSIHIPVEEMTDTTCPKCGSGYITGGFVETGSGVAVQEVSCNACDTTWRNIYDFAAVDLSEAMDGLVIEIRQELATDDLDVDAIVELCGDQSRIPGMLDSPGNMFPSVKQLAEEVKRLRAMTETARRQHNDAE